MFTGIVQEIGVVRSVEKTGDSFKLRVTSSLVSRDIKIGQSVSVNGTCLTAVSGDKTELVFDIMAETLRSTSLASVRPGERVNLEGALKAGGALDGHIVLGHVDCVGVIRSIKSSGNEFVISVEYPARFNDLIVEKGSVAVDGVSLTVNNPGYDMFEVHLIPHTLKATSLNSKRPGDGVNLEFDILGKYIERRNSSGGSGRLTEEYLRSNGF